MKKYIIKTELDGIESYYVNEDFLPTSMGAPHTLTYDKSRATKLFDDINVKDVLSDLSSDFYGMTFDSVEVC